MPSSANTEEYPLSVEEESAITALGGFEAVTRTVNKVLREHGIQRQLFTLTEQDRVRRGRKKLKEEIEFNFDTGKSLRANIEDLLQQAQEVRANAVGTNYAGVMLQHLVGAKLDLVLGIGKFMHHGFSVPDHSTERKGDFQIEAVAIHVTTHPTEALIRKCLDNLNHGIKPLIITIGDGVTGASYLLSIQHLADRVDVLDAAQFLTANVYERSLFRGSECKVTLVKLLERYNEIVSERETDPALQIHFGREGR